MIIGLIVNKKWYTQEINGKKKQQKKTKKTKKQKKNKVILPQNIGRSKNKMTLQYLYPYIREKADYICKS